MVSAAPAPLTIMGLEEADAVPPMPTVTEAPEPMSSKAAMAPEPTVKLPNENAPPLKPMLPIPVKLAAFPGPDTAKYVA